MLIITFFFATLITVICFLCLLYFIVNVLNKEYIITFVENKYQLVNANLIEFYDEKRYMLDERDYLDITLISFIMFLIYNFDNKLFKKSFENYFNKNYDTIVY